MKQTTHLGILFTLLYFGTLAQAAEPEVIPIQVRKNLRIVYQTPTHPTSP
jgi:hypothetical protein